MMNLFGAEILKTDASIRYLGQIFGSVNGVLTSGENTSLLSTMFQTFNSMILVIAVIMLVYITVLGVIGTAHEGEFMGKKMNNIWIPIRAMLGIVLLVPTGTGYCAIQIIMMWIIVQGIGAADSLWMTALNYVTVYKSPYTQVTAPVGSNTVFTGLFKGLVCDASLKKGDPKNLGNYACGSPGGCGGPPPFDPAKGSYNIPKCGSLTFCKLDDPDGGGCFDSRNKQSNPNSMRCLACQAQINTLTQAIPTLAGIAQALVNADYSYRDFKQNSWNTDNSPDWKWIYNYCASKNIPKDQCCFKGFGLAGTCKASPDAKKLPDVNSSDQSAQSASSDAVKNLYWPFWPQLEPALGADNNFIKVIVGGYQDQLNKATTTYGSGSGEASNKTLVNSIVDGAKKDGWIFAGSLYYQLASLTHKSVNEAYPGMEWSPGANTSTERNNVDAAGFLIAIASGDASQSAVSSTASSETDASVAAVNKGFMDNINPPPQTVSGSTGGDVNPLLMLQVFGAVMIKTAEGLFLIAVILILTMGIPGYLNVYVLGTGIDNPMGPWALMMMIFVMPLFWGSMALLVSIGALFSVYTPLLPYIYFTFGALAWMIATVEAMVAGPLVALGIISPSGQHEIMGKAEPAILLLFNLFLRPSLMIFGLMVAMLMAIVGVKMVNETFKLVMFNFTYVYTDPLTMVFILVAYVSLILAVLNKCFAVINLIPQQVIRWVGGHGDAVETPTDAIKGGIDSAAGKTGGAMSGTGDKAKQEGRSQMKEKKAKEAEAAKNVPKAEADNKDKGVGGKT